MILRFPHPPRKSWRCKIPFTHYPKLSSNVIFAWVWPRPPAKDNFFGQPRFDDLNLAVGPLKNGESLFAYHEAQNFTKIYGSVFADQPLEVTFSFSNDEVDKNGDYVTDETLPSLSFDAEALKMAYDPAKQSATGKYLVILYGRWLRVEVKNVGKAPTEIMRVIARGSVF